MRLIRLSVCEVQLASTVNKSLGNIESGHTRKDMGESDMVPGKEDEQENEVDTGEYEEYDADEFDFVEAYDDAPAVSETLLPLNDAVSALNVLGLSV